jgi:hypothetical protein
MIERNFDEYFRSFNLIEEPKVDRWQLYDYCLKNVTPEE